MNIRLGFRCTRWGSARIFWRFGRQFVPVGEDQLPHLEMSREVARRFDQMYCGVDPHTEDEDYLKGRRIVPGDSAQAWAGEAAGGDGRAIRRRRDSC